MEQLRHQEQEVMICMMLDNQNHLLERYRPVKGNGECDTDHAKGGIPGGTSLSCSQSDPDT